MHFPGLIICLKCEQGMPKTSFITEPDNPVAQLFWGRVFLQGATSLFRFEKGSKYQHLLHLLKYKGLKKVGIFLGNLLGAEIQDSSFAKIDYIIPVPLHKKREKQRGYNQSEVIAQGVSMIINKPINTELVFRCKYTQSQTSKKRFERWENMENVFSLSEEAELLSNTTILLIDDVITTGSTLEACAELLLTIPGVKIYIASVACA